jgi:DNA-binding response OmpR family regulator
MLERPVTGAESTSHEMRILFVHGGAEPELTRELARNGHDVLDVAEDESSTRLLRVFEPHVVLVAGHDVPRACHELRLHAAEVPIVAMVAGRNLEARIAALSSGADDCLSVPFHPAELLARLLAATRRRAPWVARPQMAREPPLGGTA